MTYKSNVNKVLSKLKRAVMSSEAQDKMVRACATAVLGSNLRRVHNDGLAVNMRKIGTYSTKPIYINASTPIKISPLGKPINGKSGRSTFKNGKKHKTRYFKGGYREYRSHIKKESGFVNLQIRGVTLKANFRMIREGRKYLIGFITQKAVDVSEGMETKYRTRIWGLTRKDYTLCREIVHNYIRANA